MKKRTPKDWRRLVAEYERGIESRREFCERRALSMSTLDYWRRRRRGETGGRLVEVEIETDGSFVVSVRRPRIGNFGRARSGDGRLGHAR